MISPAERLRDLCKSRGVSLKTFAQECGLTYGTLSKQVREGLPVPFATLEAASLFFGVPLEYFSSHRAAILLQGAPASTALPLREHDLAAIREGLVISTDAVLSWLEREGYVLRNYEALREKIDLFHPAHIDDPQPRPARLGAESLASIFFDLDGVRDYSEKIAGFDEGIRRELVSAHVAVQKSSRYRVDDIEISAEIGSGRVSGKYRRIMAPVRDLEGVAFTLVFARLIEAFEILPNAHNRRAMSLSSNVTKASPEAPDHATRSPGG